jgi:uncharacterized membrane protein
MESRFKILGHPLHQMLIAFPLGLLVTAVIFDGIHYATASPRWAEVAYWMIAAGLIGGLLAAVPGVVDWAAIPSGTRAKAIGTWHGLGNVCVLVLFAISLYLRSDNPSVPTAAASVLSLVGLLLGAVTAWLGGELVDRLGVGVDPGAHLNAPNSLSGRPAGEVSGGPHVPSPAR